MNADQKPDRELSDLIEAWHDGDLTADQQARLAWRMENEPSARRCFREATRFETLLHSEFPDSVVHFPTPARAWFRNRSLWLAAAACIALVGSIAMLKTGNGKSPAANSYAGGSSPQDGPSLIDTTPVARVSLVNNATFAPDSLSVSVGALLPPGILHLTKGSAELTFFSGARVTLQAPCMLQLKSDFRATLLQGSLTAQVPPQAIGFTIHTPSGQLRDLGTSFVVSVKGNGDADVHVLDGKVEAAPKGATSLVTLVENQATRISEGTLTPIRFDATGWPDRPRTIKNELLPNAVSWSLDLFEEDQSLDANSVHPLWMRSASPRSSPSARLQRGIKGQALSFNGVNEFAESSYRGVSGSQPRAVALWVKIPPDASYHYPNGIVAWGRHEQSRKWQVCWNNGDQGTVGALRVEFGDGYVIGTTDLRDGLWHHITAVYLGGFNSDVGSHVKLYVDGRLETLSGRRSQYILTDTESPQAIGVTLGRWLGNWPGKAPFYFRGEMDEVAIFEDALTPDQVMKLATP